MTDSNKMSDEKEPELFQSLVRVANDLHAANKRIEKLEESNKVIWRALDSLGFGLYRDAIK